LIAASVTRIDWGEWDESLPAFLILIGMPLTYSIVDGMALGFILYPFIKIFAGKIRQVHWCMHLIALLFILRYMTGG